MLWLGIDDTDTLDTPGTNKLVLHLTRVLAPEMTARLVVRHQLFFDPRIPYTSHNGAASLLVELRADWSLEILADRMGSIIREWSPAGSDPGLCIAPHVPQQVVDFGQRCQHEVVSQAEAHALAAEHGLYLASLGGTGDGVIGALAAVGLLATNNDGRVLHQGYGEGEPFDVRGCLPVQEILRRGVTRVEHLETGESIDQGNVELSKRLRPNLRNGELILFVKAPEEASCDAEWQAVKVT